jgi:hypothetical protein
VTRRVTPIGEDDRMRDQPRLQPDTQLHCPHCHRWHGVIAVHTTGTAYTIAMRYWQCGDARYYAGQNGGTSRHETRLVADRSWDASKEFGPHRGQ